MDYVFDPRKDLANQQKHGVSLGLAEYLFNDMTVTVTDDRFDYGEVRRVAFGRIEGRLFVCVYVDQDRQRRIISLRKANRREERRYGQST